MHRKFTLSLFLLFLGFLVQAQQPSAGGNAKITGKVIDSVSRKPIEYATVTLYEEGSKKAFNGATTDSTGMFAIANISTVGTYNVVAEFMGYKAHTLRKLAVIKKNDVVDIGSIALVAIATTLQGVTVTAQARVIENKIDKMVFNAEKDITSQTGVATDILRKVPQVTVGVDGNVELAGNASIRFLINGKPSSAFGSNIADVLQAIPANQIKSIEVITNPGAKYDAQGLGGIINIILKKSNAQGINGNLSLTGGTRTENGSFNFNARKGKFAVNAFVSGNTRLRANTPSYSDRVTNDTAASTNIYLHQDGLSRIHRHGLQAGAGFDWSYNDKNSLTGAISFNSFGTDGSGYTNQLQDSKDDGGNSSNISKISSINNTDNAFRFHNIDANLNYKRTFNKEDKELDIALNSSLGNSYNRTSSMQFLQPAHQLYYGNNSTNPGNQNDNELLIDYTQPLKKNVILGVGSKANFIDIASSSDVLTYNNPTGQYQPNPFLTNNLNYHQKVYALYSELTFLVAKLFDAKVGGRYERTEIEAFYSNAQQQRKVPGYNSFVPSIYLSKKLGENGGALRLSYSKRIGRPDYGDLNPFVNTSDPKNISTGNPNLVPESSKRYEFAYNKDLGKAGSFMVNLFYRLNMNDIQPFVTYYPEYTVGDTTYTHVAVSTRQNIGTEKNIGFNLFTDLRLVKKMSIRTNMFFFHRDIINAIDKGYNSSSFNYRFNLNSSYQFTNTLFGEFFGNFNSARNEAQGKYPSFTNYSFAVRKQFWNKNGSLALTATNPFKDVVNMRTSLYGPNFIVTSQRSIPFRSFGLNFTWKFGRLEFKKEKEPNENSNPALE
ncbi:outer membrane beta-barrel family protein [Segetibacter koreensis]|uniref:outer membrane beta-barrel family protein n=1 Tax=Segetibacter koreensis TaxID=398037 RepID=UPI00036181CC|nr:outer membrane beta-barrel family protein [Segetibacter koreensis]